MQHAGHQERLTMEVPGSGDSEGPTRRKTVDSNTAHPSAVNPVMHIPASQICLQRSVSVPRGAEGTQSRRSFDYPPRSQATLPRTVLHRSSLPLPRVQPPSQESPPAGTDARKLKRSGSGGLLATVQRPGQCSFAVVMLPVNTLNSKG